MPPEQLAETWRRCSSRLLLIARSIGEPAEDAVQEAFLQLARQSPPPDDPFAWLVKVTRNQILQWRRSRDRRRRRERSRSEQPWFEQGQLRVDSSMDGKRVTEALQSLEPEQRQIIVMHLWGNLSFQQIAQVMNRSRSTIHRTYQSGIQAMKRQFNPESDQLTGSHRR